MEMKQIRVMLVDDHEIVRAGFRRLLDSTDDIEVVAEAGSAEDAFRLYLKQHPDVVVMDLSMPPGNGGLEALKRILTHDRKARVLVLTVQECEPFPSRVMEFGAKGYLTKRCAPEELIKAIKTVARGGEYIASHIRTELEGRSGSKLDNLTKRELQVFTLLAKGMSTTEIAELMFISNKTVHTHRANILSKLDLTRTSDLIHLAIRHGVVDA